MGCICFVNLLWELEEKMEVDMTKIHCIPALNFQRQKIKIKNRSNKRIFYWSFNLLVTFLFNLLVTFLFYKKMGESKKREERWKYKKHRSNQGGGRITESAALSQSAKLLLKLQDLAQVSPPPCSPPSLHPSSSQVLPLYGTLQYHQTA